MVHNLCRQEDITKINLKMGYRICLQFYVSYK